MVEYDPTTGEVITDGGDPVNKVDATEPEKQPASVGQVLFASLLGLTGIGFVVATLAIRQQQTRG